MKPKLGPKLHFETSAYILRSLVPGDENEAWGSWLEDPETALMLNSQCRTRPLSELRDYIGKYDRVNRHLFGIFDKASGAHVGIRTAEINRANRSWRVNLLIGKSADRNRGAQEHSSELMHHWGFETLDLLQNTATLVGHNKRFVQGLLDRGWVITGNKLGKSVTGQPLGLVDMALDREIWRAHPRGAAIKGL